MEMTKFPSTPGTQGPSGMPQASIVTTRKELLATAIYWWRAGLTRELLSEDNYLEMFWRISALLPTLQRTGERILSWYSNKSTMENIIRLETSEDAVAVLNILGYHGYKVVGVGNSMDNRMVWTLERKFYEFHKDEL